MVKIFYILLKLYLVEAVLGIVCLQVAEVAVLNVSLWLVNGVFRRVGVGVG